MAGEKDELNEFYTALKNGTTVTILLERCERIIQFIHKEGLTKDFRLARGLVKKLRDEVSPVARFVRKHAAPEDRIRFALDDTVPDCCLWHDDRLREIEVTVAQAKERLNVMTELNETGTARGFLGLSDDTPKEDFVRMMDQPRVAYSTEELGRSIICAVAISARKKSNSHGDTLLIEAPLETLPANQWDDFRPHLAEKVKGLAFREVYVTGRSERDICLRIK